MGHSAPAKTGAIVQRVHVAAPVPIAFVPSQTLVRPATPSDSLAFTRAHDPPHLHTFALLI
jgi:hypothetical protein